MSNGDDLGTGLLGDPPGDNGTGHTLPPGVSLVELKCGFNAATFEFVTSGQEIFDVSFGEFENDGSAAKVPGTPQMITLTINQFPNSYAVPDGFLAELVSTQATSETKSLSWRSSETDSEVSTAFEASLGYAGCSTSISHAVEKATSTATETLTSADSAFAYISIFQLTRAYADAGMPINVSQTFKDAVGALPADASDDKPYTDFINTWGTHYVERLVYGGTFALWATSSKTEFSDEEHQAISDTLEAGFHSADVNANAKASMKSALTAKLGTRAEDVSISTQSIGGIGGASSLDQWQEHVQNLPARLISPTSILEEALRPRFKSLSTLMPSTVGARFDKVVAALLDKPRQQAQAAPATPVAVGAVYTAPVPGIVQGRIYIGESDGVLRQTVNLTSGPTVGNPNQPYDAALAAAGIEATREGDHAYHITTTTLTSPVPAGQDYLVKSLHTEGSPLSNLQFMPWPSLTGEPPQKLSVNDWHEFGTAGIVTAFALNSSDDYAEYGAAAKLTVIDKDGKTYAAPSAEMCNIPSSRILLRGAGVCVPLPKSARVAANPEHSGSVFIGANFFALAEGYDWGPPEQLDGGKLQALSDGVLVVVLGIEVSTFLGMFSLQGQGRALIRCHEDEAALNTDPAIVGGVTVAYHQGSSQPIGQGAATIFVKKGTHVRVDYDWTEGAAMTQTATWYPLVGPT